MVAQPRVTMGISAPPTRHQDAGLAMIVREGMLVAKTQLISALGLVCAADLALDP